MDDESIIVLPLLLFIVLWIVLSRVRRVPLQASTHFGLTVTLVVLSIFGFWTMTSLNSGGFSGLVIYGWIAYGIPVAVVVYLLSISYFTITRTKQLRKLEESTPSRNKFILSVVFIVSFLVIVIGYYYVEHLESRLHKQDATEASLRSLYNNPVVRIFPHLRFRLASHRSIPLDLLAKLFEDSSQQVWWASCRNDKATYELLLKASKSAWPNNKICVLVNRNAPIELLREWSGDANERIRRYVARHKNTPPDVLLILSRDESPSVQGSVANNASTSGDALARLASSDNPRLRRYVARHANTPFSVLMQLAKDSEPKVRLGFFFRVHLPLQIIETLLNDTNEEVQTKARNRLKEHERQRKVVPLINNRNEKVTTNPVIGVIVDFP